MKDFVWKLFTINKKDEIEDVGKNIKELDNYCKELKRLSKDREYCMNVWSERLEENLSNLSAYNNGKEEGEKIGKEEGEKIGREEGIAFQQKETVINMHRDQMSSELISKYVNLSVEEVEKIINSFEK